MINIELNNGDQAKVGDFIEGNLIINSKKDLKLKNISISLEWRTEGRGDEDKGWADSKVFDVKSLRANHTKKFPFKLKTPKSGPVSYNGEIIRIIWSLVGHLDIPWAKDKRKTVNVTILPNLE